MKIVHVVFSFCTGGLETMLVDIMRVQAERDEVHLVIINDVVDSKLMASIDERVHIHRLGRRAGTRSPFWLLRSNWLISRLGADVVHIHQGKIARLLCAGPQPVLTVHALHIPMDSSARRCRMIAISEAVADDLRNRYEDGADVSVIANGIDTDAIAMRPEESIHQPVRLVQVARFDVRKKGQDILLHAVARLVEAGRDVRVTLIGGADYENVPRLERLAEELGISERVEIRKGLSRTELYRALGEFDIMVHPARFEGFGLVIAEGMAAGLPLVVPDEGGPYEVSDKGRFAATFRMEDVEGCAEAIASVIDNYDQKRVLAKEARKYVESKYSLRRMVDAYREFYNKKGV